MRKPAFTLIELIISVALLIVAISIALFATVGVNGLIQRSEARGVISEAGRTTSDEIRRVVNNAPVGGVAPVGPYTTMINGVPVPDGTYAGIQVVDFSSAQSSSACTVIGRAIVSSTPGGEEQYSIDPTGTLVAVMIYTITGGTGRCPDMNISTPIYQNRLTNNQSIVKDMRFYLQTIPCQPVVAPSCISKQLLRYAMTVELVQKVTGNTSEAKKPTLTLQDGLPIGLVNEATSSLSIDSSTLAGGTVGSAYSDSVIVSGGLPSYTWSLNTGSTPLPPGLTLQGTTGVISGTPTTAGTYTPTIKVVDSASGSVTKPISITIANAPVALTIATTSLPGGTVGTAYSQSVTASGGVTPYTWTLLSGTLPPTLTLTSGTPSATISGTPTTANTYNFTVKVTDSAASPASATQALSIVIAAGGSPLTITTPSSLPNAVPNCAYSQTLTASGGTPGYTWSVVSGFPIWLSLSTGGVLSGTAPASGGPYSLIVKVSDSASPKPNTVNGTFSLSLGGLCGGGI